MFDFPTSCRHFDVDRPPERAIRVLSDDAMHAAMYCIFSGGDIDKRLGEYSDAAAAGVDLNDKFLQPIEDDDGECKIEIDASQVMKPEPRESTFDFVSYGDTAEVFPEFYDECNIYEASLGLIGEEVPPAHEFKMADSNDNSLNDYDQKIENSREVVELVTSSAAFIEKICNYPIAEDEYVKVSKVLDRDKTDVEEYYFPYDNIAIKYVIDYNVNKITVESVSFPDLIEDSSLSKAGRPSRAGKPLEVTGISRRYGSITRMKPYDVITGFRDIDRRRRPKVLSFWSDVVNKYSDLNYFRDAMIFDNVQIELFVRVKKFRDYFRTFINNDIKYGYTQWLNLFVMVEQPNFYEMLRLMQIPICEYKIKLWYYNEMLMKHYGTTNRYADILRMYRCCDRRLLRG